MAVVAGTPLEATEAEAEAATQAAAATLRLDTQGAAAISPARVISLEVDMSPLPIMAVVMCMVRASPDTQVMPATDIRPVGTVVRGAAGAAALGGAATGAAGFGRARITARVSPGSYRFCRWPTPRTGI